MGFVRNVVGSITGSSQARAIQQGSQAQQEATREAIELARQQQEQFRSDLEPFRQFGVGLLPQVQQAFGAEAGQAITQDPVFQALSGEARKQIEARQAARGRTFLPETDIAIQDALLRTGSSLLGQRQQNLLSALGLGQSSAAQVGAAGLQGAAQQGNLLQQIANAQAAGLQGAAGARAAGVGNLLQLGGAIFSDERLKENITKIGEEKGYNIYEYNYLGSTTKHTGVLAQEVEKVNPGAVFEIGGYKAVNYARL